MASDSSFDVVSKFDAQEVENAINMAAKEVGQRFDFKGTDSSIRKSGDHIEMESNGEERVKAVLDVFQSKLIKRGISLKQLDAGEPRLSGKVVRLAGPPGCGGLPAAQPRRGWPSPSTVGALRLPSAPRRRARAPGSFWQPRHRRDGHRDGRVSRAREKLS